MQPLGDSRQNIKQTKVQRSRNIRWILQPLAFDTIFQQFWHCVIWHNFPTILTLCALSWDSQRSMKCNFATVRGGSSRNLKHYFDTTMFVDKAWNSAYFGSRFTANFQFDNSKSSDVRELTGQRKKNLAIDCPARIRILSILTNQIKRSQQAGNLTRFFSPDVVDLKNGDKTFSGDIWQFRKKFWLFFRGTKSITLSDLPISVFFFFNF